MSTAAPPQFPAGSFEPCSETSAAREQAMNALRAAPGRLRQAVSGLQPTQLNTAYRNWTVRQIVHHLADSHMHSCIRFKWALTEPQPTIKAYDESAWSALSEARHGDIEPSLALLDSLHRRWLQLMETLQDADWQRSFVHPETGETVRLSQAVGYYAWHSRHHTGQILWLREHNQWS